MRQININVTDEFDQDLRLLMRARKIRRKSDAIREGIHELAERTRRRRAALEALRGIALKYPANPNPRFRSEDDLW